jgi:signal transduction histidine kinase
MSQLIKDLLAYSHVLHDEPESFEPVNLNETVDAAIENLNTSIENSGAQVTHSDLPVISANPNRMLQLFQNLIGNAIKYRSEAPPRIHIDARRLGTAWIFSVTDNGVGVDPADREKIFGLFKRTKHGTAPGSGVGLAICHAIVEKHGGRIWVEPVPGGGSIFSFTLPAPQGL